MTRGFFLRCAVFANVWFQSTERTLQAHREFFSSVKFSRRHSLGMLFEDRCGAECSGGDACAELLVCSSFWHRHVATIERPYPYRPRPLPHLRRLVVVRRCRARFSKTPPPASCPSRRAELEVWLQEPRWGRPLGRLVETDPNGRYEIRDLPPQSLVVLYAFVPGKPLQQRCAATAAMGDDATLDIELVSAAVPYRATGVSPTLSGLFTRRRPKGQGQYKGGRWDTTGIAMMGRPRRG